MAAILARKYHGLRESEAHKKSRSSVIAGRPNFGNMRWVTHAPYTGNPFCPANSFNDTCGLAPMCWITSAAASAPSRPAAS